jgi:hypothetical protein
VTVRREDSRPRIGLHAIALLSRSRAGRSKARPALAVLAACTLASIVALPAQGARSEGIAAGSTARLARTRPAQRAAIGVLRLGDSYHLAGGYNRYDYLIVGYGDLRAASVRSATSLIYKGAADVTESPSSDPGRGVSGVSRKEAAANGWLLKDAAGNPLQIGSNDWLGDVGSAAFQMRWATNVSRYLHAHHIRGVFIDNVACSVLGLTHGGIPAKYPTDAAWANAQASFIASVGRDLRKQGLYVAVNAYCGGPDNGSGNDAWWARLAPNVSGLMVEDFEQNPNDESQLYFDAPAASWMGNWRGKLNVIRVAQRLGRDALALTWGDRGDTAKMTYARASFLLVWNGKGGAFFYNTRDGSDPWNPMWTTSIGVPRGGLRQVGPAYVRSYSAGYVVVNPSQSPASVQIPGGLKTLSGGPASSPVALAPVSAAIFRR